MWGPAQELVESNGFPYWYYSVMGEKWFPEYVTENRVDLVIKAMESWDEDISDEIAYLEEVRSGRRLLRESVDYGDELSDRYEHARPIWADREKIEWLEGQRDQLTATTGHHWELCHYHPIDGKKVCGLHVHENLKVIKRDERTGKEVFLTKADLL